VSRRKSAIEAERRYRAKHREELNRRQRDWAANNRMQARKSAADWYMRNKDKARATRRRSKLRQFGLTVEQFAALLAKQGGMCAICRGPQQVRKGEITQFALDHNHMSGRPRGLLCGRCNRVLGSVNEDEALLQAMISYLRRWNTPREVQEDD
jgi:hypothetical protein